MRLSNVLSLQDLSRPIPGRLLPLLRFGWAALALSALLITLIGIVAVQRTFSLPCAEQGLLGEEIEFCINRSNGLLALGLTWPFFATWLAFFAAIELLPWFLAGLLIFWRRSGDWFGLIFSLALVLGGTSIVDEGIISWAIFAYPALEPLTYWLQFIGVTSAVIFLYFPDGKPAFRWAGWVGVLYVLRSIGIWILPGTALDVTSWPEPMPLVVTALIAGLFAFSLVQKFRHPTDPYQRQQIKWVVFASVVFILLYLAVQIAYIWVETGIEEIRIQLTLATVYKLASGIMALSFVIAILRYKLFDIDIIIRRTLTYSLLTVLLAGVYFAGVILSRGIIIPITGRQETPGMIVLTTLAIAALFNPLRHRIQRTIDRRFFRAKYDAEQALLRFSTAIRDEVDLDRMTITLLEVVNETLQPERVELWLKVEGQETARRGQPLHRDRNTTGVRVIAD